MEEVQGRLTIYFEEPFWVGVFERQYRGKLEIAKITFGPEPKDYDVYAYLMEKAGHLRYGALLSKGKGTTLPKNPKRRQREIHRQVLGAGVGTKAQQALNLIREENKFEKRQFTKMEKQAEQDRIYQIKRQKQKEKHKGR